MAINSNLTLIERLNETQASIDSMEQILGKGLDQPFNCSNSGARKILYSTQKDHVIPIEGAEPAFVQTGYENRFGDESSSIIKATCDLEVIAEIPKFSFTPKSHYFIIFKDDNNHYDIYERIQYQHTSESYGYLFDNRNVDKLNVGDRLNAGDIIRSSASYDDYGNRQDGCNLICGYIATDKNTEDSLIISESASKLLSTTLFRKVTIIYNDNDIPLNMYGKDGEYKSFPDIGEEIQRGILASVRRENKEQSLFTQSYSRLSDIMMSDDKYTIKGSGARVIDIDISANNADLLDSFYNVQLKKYVDELKRFSSEVLQVANMIKANDPSAVFEYDFTKVLDLSTAILEGRQYDNNGKVFTHTVIDFYIAEDMPANIGDKCSDRYGGKGVISFKVPDELMPLNDLGQRLHAIINQSTCVNRENPGQLMETTLTHIGARIVNFIEYMKLDIDEALDLIIEFISLVTEEEAMHLKNYLDSLDYISRSMYLESIMDTGMMYLSLRPIQDNLTLEKIDNIYKHFPWIKQSYLISPIRDSNDNIRYVKSRRGIITGYKYMFRLKQHADDKFSSTSMSATNIKNLNTKNKSYKNYKSVHSNTPIAKGNMEIDDEGHIGYEYIITNLMIHSVSPHARRRCEEMLTGDPFDIDIKLDDESTNRNVEILNAYLKAKGQRIVTAKILKKTKPFINWKPKSFIKWEGEGKAEKVRKSNFITWDMDEKNK